MSITDRLRQFFGREVTPVPPNTSREIVPPSRPSDLRQRYSAESGRHDVVTRCREMAANDPRAEGALRTLARDVVKDGCTVTVTGGPRAEDAQRVADALFTRLAMNKKLYGWMFATARDGDSFQELGVSAEWEIVEVTSKPVLQMSRLSDEFDRFADPARAFAWSDRMLTALGQTSDSTVYFPLFLMVHARWEHDAGNRYGTPEFASAIPAWKKIKEGEIDVAVRRQTRSGVRYVHRIPNADETELEAYKEANQESFDRPFAAVSDYFMNFPEGGIDVLAGDARLGDIADVEHHIQTWSAASSVPLELLAYGANLNRDVLEDKRAQYEETLGHIREWAADELVRPILERQWLLAGILPDSHQYTIGWSTQQTLSPAELKALADTISALKAAGLTKEAIWALVQPYLPADADVDTFFAATAEEAPPVLAAPEPAGGDNSLAAAEAIGAVNRLLGRLEVIHDDALAG